MVRHPARPRNRGSAASSRHDEQPTTARRDGGRPACAGPARPTLWMGAEGHQEAFELEAQFKANAEAKL
jgi:hypothetical protein